MGANKYSPMEYWEKEPTQSIPPRTLLFSTGFSLNKLRVLYQKPFHVPMVLSTHPGYFSENFSIFPWFYAEPTREVLPRSSLGSKSFLKNTLHTTENPFNVRKSLSGTHPGVSTENSFNDGTENPWQKSSLRISVILEELFLPEIWTKRVLNGTLILTNNSWWTLASKKVTWFWLFKNFGTLISNSEAGEELKGQKIKRISSWYWFGEVFYFCMR